MVPPSQCSYAHNTPIVQPSYTTPRKTPLDTYTCIRTNLNPFSVSISSQPAVRFSKSIPRLTRLQRSSLSSSQDATPSSSLELKKSEEQDKWWHWARLCKVTGDGNKSSHLPPLRCRDLKRNSDQYHTDLHQDQELRIHTRPLCESALEQQKFHYSGWFFFCCNFFLFLFSYKKISKNKRNKLVFRIKIDSLYAWHVSIQCIIFLFYFILFILMCIRQFSRAV